MLPIVLGNKPTKYIRVDKLPPLEGKFAVHLHLSETKENAHIKLEYGNTDYCLSLYVFKIKHFFENKEVKVRSYDLWPKWIMFCAKYKGRIHEFCKERKVYREDAEIIGWGNYKLENSKIIFNFSDRKLFLGYKILFHREVRYYSPKYGYSIRSEYIFKPIDLKEK